MICITTEQQILMSKPILHLTLRERDKLLQLKLKTKIHIRWIPILSKLLSKEPLSTFCQCALRFLIHKEKLNLYLKRKMKKFWMYKLEHNAAEKDSRLLPMLLNIWKQMTGITRKKCTIISKRKKIEWYLKKIWHSCATSDLMMN